jgi:hypothetical protein
MGTSAGRVSSEKRWTDGRMVRGDEQWRIVPDR